MSPSANQTSKGSGTVPWRDSVVVVVVCSEESRLEARLKLRVRKSVEASSYDAAVDCRRSSERELERKQAGRTGQAKAAEANGEDSKSLLLHQSAGGNPAIIRVEPPAQREENGRV